MIVSYSSINNDTELYGQVYKGCNDKYYVLWTNIPVNFDLQMSGDLNIWTNLVEIRNNKSMHYFTHPIINTNDVGFFRLIVN
jgi:hypothetical protein